MAELIQGIIIKCIFVNKKGMTIRYTLSLFPYFVDCFKRFIRTWDWNEFNELAFIDRIDCIGYSKEQYAEMLDAEMLERWGSLKSWEEVRKECEGLSVAASLEIGLIYQWILDKRKEERLRPIREHRENIKSQMRKFNQERYKMIKIKN